MKCPLFAALLASLLVVSRSAGAPIPVKVVVLNTFEIGDDAGDKIGEFQPWVEGEKLDQVIELPAAHHPLRTNGKGLYGTYTGMGGNRAAASLMALGLDPRFDFSKAYFIVGGIAGVNPAEASLGSAAWAEYVVSTDLAHYVDPREAPADWKNGFFPIDLASPSRPVPDVEALRWHDTVVFKCNPGLVRWAYSVSKDTVLPDSEKMRVSRERYTGFPNAVKPPFVRIGDTVSGNTFWHGKLMSSWAVDWVGFWTKGKGTYTTTAMEDVGMMQAFTWLAQAGKIDPRRVLVLRTASNYDQQPPGLTAAQSLEQEESGDYSGYVPACRAHYLVGSRVADELIAHWDRYENEVPQL